MEKIYIEEYILSYERVREIANTLWLKNRDRMMKKSIGNTSFGYPIDTYTIGKGSKHVVILGATHGCEIVTTYFVLEMMATLLEEYQELGGLIEHYTFHLIPILNVEGYVISSSQVVANLEGASDTEIEKTATRYLEAYNRDDLIARKGIKCEKEFYGILNSSICHIKNIPLRHRVAGILTSCHLTDAVLPIWAANGCGVDPNSNSIHCFEEMKCLRAKQRVAALRYNDIPVTKPSPMSYPGTCTFCHCPENFYLYQFICNLYQLNEHTDIKDKLVAIFSYHATGGEIYGYPCQDGTNDRKTAFYQAAMNVYASETGYQVMRETLQYGVMDFYRAKLNEVLALTIELSKENGNPIGPFSNLDEFLKEVLENKNAIIATICHMFGE